MILISALVTTALITFAQSTPLSYSMYRRRALESGERPRFSLLFNQIPELENEPFDSSSSRDVAITRPKRIGSLSIVNPLDVLRERVILELARKKMRQDQRQVDANRRLLDNIGKRSSSDSEETRTSNFKDNVDYSIYRMYPSEQRIDESQPLSGVDRNVERTQSWYSGGDPTVREAQDQGQARRMTGELQLL